MLCQPPPAQQLCCAVPCYAVLRPLQMYELLSRATNVPEPEEVLSTAAVLRSTGPAQRERRLPLTW